MKQQVLLAQIDLYKSVSVLNGTLFFILFFSFWGWEEVQQEDWRKKHCSVYPFQFFKNDLGTGGFCQDLFKRHWL